mgnify:FL=1
MVNIDTVYQTVLALANKEQRGYITPQEFNLFAEQAQMSIFEQYFYDLNQFLRIPGNNTSHADVVSILEEKISLFEKTGVPVGGGTVLPANLYKLQQVLWKESGQGNQNQTYNVEPVDQKTYSEMRGISLVKPTDKRLVYIRNHNGIAVVGDNQKTSNVTCNYISAPPNPNWAYVVVDEKALYNPNLSINFHIHHAEQTDLVVKILGLAGVTLKDPNLYQIASAEESKSIQKQKQ